MPCRRQLYLLRVPALKLLAIIDTSFATMILLVFHYLPFLTAAVIKAIFAAMLPRRWRRYFLLSDAFDMIDISRLLRGFRLAAIRPFRQKHHAKIRCLQLPRDAKI